MPRRLAVAAVASIAAIAAAGSALAAGGHSATTYKATLTAVNPAATTAGVASVGGKARLVDGKNRNKVNLHMRHLAPGAMYLWHVHAGSCAATGAPVPGWTYRTQVGTNGTLTANASGNANTKGRSATFNAEPGTSYSVNVHIAAPTNGLPAGTIIACGDLTTKAKKADKGKAGGSSKSKKADKSPTTKPHGKSTKS